MYANMLPSARSAEPTRRRIGCLSTRQQQLAVRLIEESVEERISISQLAQACGISRSHFSRAFTKTMGLPACKYQQIWKIEVAKRLLRETDFPLVEISARCGFNDQPHFTRTFKATTGSTPLAWKRSMTDARPAVVAAHYAGSVEPKTPGTRQERVPGALSR